MLRLRVATVVFLVLLAGCSGAIQDTTPTSTRSTTTSSVETTTTTSAASTTIETTAETTTTVRQAEIENPWSKQNVTVAVSNTVNQSRNVAPLVDETLAYWNDYASEYGDYNVTFVSTTNTYNADIVVKFVTRITECDGEATNSTVGCAPNLDPWDTPDDPAHVRIVAGYSNKSTLQILKHEFGHVLGIDHGEEPMPTMQAIGQFRHLSQPDVTDRPVPWQNSTLSIYTNVETLPDHDRDDAREQIQHVLDYYDAGADGAVPQNVSFVRTTNRSAADVQIRFPDDAFDCAGERMREGSCGSSWAYNTDTDDAPEYFSSYSIRVRGLDMDAVGWHVGYWLASAMGLNEDEFPAPFVDAGHHDRRSEWWE